MNRNTLPVAVAVLAAAVAAGGCASDDSPKTAAVTAEEVSQPLGPADIPEQTTKPEGAYNGHYSGVLTHAQAVKFGDPKFAGKVTLTLRPSGSYLMTDTQG